MPTARPWGALVASALPLACSPAALPAPPPPATLPTLAASAPPAPPALSPMVDVLAGVPDEPGARQPSLEVAEHTVPFGRGALVHRAYLTVDTPCPVTRSEGCGSFSLRVDSAAPPLWPSPTPVAPTGPAVERGPLAAPHAWVAFAGGRDAVYALRKGGKRIDRVDDQGRVTPFIVDDAIPDTWDTIHVVEHPGHVTLVGARSQELVALWRGDDPWKAMEVLAPGPDGLRRLGPAVELPMLDIASGRLSAQGVRDVTQHGRKAALAAPELLALPDEGADRNRWALVWLELVAPAYRWPEGRPQRGVPVRPTVRGKKGARHECGGSSFGKMSRNVDDESVAKHAHVTLYAGARQLDDAIAWSGSAVGPTDPDTKERGGISSLTLEPYLEGGRVIVPLPDQPRPPAATPAPHRTRQEHSKALASHHEEVLAVAFDEASGEGLVAVRDRTRSWWRRFDAAGRPVGEPQPLSVDVAAAARAEGRWMALGNTPTCLYNLTDRTGPFTLTRGMAIDRGLALAPGLLVQIDDGWLRTTPFGPEGITGPGADVAPIPATFSALRRPIATLRGAPVIAFVDATVGDDDRSTHSVAWRPLAGGPGEWRRIALPGLTGLSAHLVSLRSLPGEVVAAVEQDRSEVMAWLGAGTTTTRPLAGSLADRPGQAIEGGPLLGGGLRLPPAPGAPVADPALAGADRECQHSVATGPDAIVLVCQHPTGPTTPDLRVGLRTLRVGAR